MMELADVSDSKSDGSDTVRVRPPLPAPKKEPIFVYDKCGFFLTKSVLAEGAFDLCAPKVYLLFLTSTAFVYTNAKRISTDV